MNKSDKPRYWFGAKLYGWSYRPLLNWQGCVSYAVWLTVWVAAAQFVRKGQLQHPFQTFAFFFGMIAVLLGILKWKGEP